MLLPIRCFTCGKVIGGVWNKYIKLRKQIGNIKALNELKLNKICCRRMLITNYEIIDTLLEYNKKIN
jgi:DNA-directed RNA polymerase I, II, and III subunit RPABC5